MRRIITALMILSLTTAFFPSPAIAAVSSPTFWANWFFIHPEIKSAPRSPGGLGAPVTAVWANSSHLDLFMTGGDGAVWSTWWEYDPNWQPWFTIHPEIKAAPGAPVTAVWANSSHLDLFMTGSDGTVWSTWWEAGKNWQPWFSIHPETKAAPGARISAVWANSSHLDLFMTGGDGAVWSTWWESAANYQPWFTIHPEIKAAPGAPVTALWSNPYHLDLFMTGSDGTVWSTWWESAAGYQPWFSIYPATKAAPSAPVTAVWATSSHLDLFMSGRDGVVYSTWYEPQYNWQPWFSIHPETKAAPGALVTALWSNPNHLDLFATDSNGVINTTWWEAGPNWQPWGGIHPENHASPGAPITAAWSTPSHLDLFFTSPDGTVTSTFFDLAGSPNWGLLANPGFDGNIVKTVYFFAGDWKYGNPVPKFYEFQTYANNDLYTIHPSDARNLGWSESTANQAFAVDAMVNAGTNVVTMSDWGQRGLDRWAFWAPMQTSTYAHDELFNTAVGRNILIMPAIESGDATTCFGGNSPNFQFASDFPGTQNNPSPALVTQIEDLVNRYINAPANPKWPSKWAQIYDGNGVKRYAINLIHVASNQINGDDHRTFAAGFDWVANKVYQDTHVLVGFTLDLLPSSIAVSKGDCSTNTIRDTYTADANHTGGYLRVTSSVLAVQGFIPEVYAGSSNQPYLEQVKWAYQSVWKHSGVPVYLDVDPGYDAHVVFKGSEIWGNNADWRKALSAMRTSNIKGIAFNTWNGYTEGYAAVPTLEFGDAAYQWLVELFGGSMPKIVLSTHPTFVQPGQSVILHVAGTGDAPLSYEWFEGYSGQTDLPVSIPGVLMDSLTINNVTQTLHFWVRTSNLAGSVDSPTYTVSAFDPSLNIYMPIALK